MPRYNPLRPERNQQRAKPARRGSRVPQLRLLPVTIIVAMAMLMVRVNDIWTVVDSHGFLHIALNQSEAQQPPPPGGKKKGTPQPAQPVAAPASKTAPSQGNGGGTASSGTTGAATPAAVPAGQATEGEPPIFTQNEVDVLEKLAARRTALDARERDVAARENLIKAAEERIDKKIAEMKAVQADVKAMLQKIDAEDDAKLKSLVKVYETMKPKDAARIFEQLDMPVLLGVVSNMKEQKLAAIMEVMDAAKAKALTDALAARRTTKFEGKTAGAEAANGTQGAAPAAAGGQSAAAGGNAGAAPNPPGGG
jgi:flagellar motility protein MotE (MotC chaperone)